MQWLPEKGVPSKNDIVAKNFSFSMSKPPIDENSTVRAEVITNISDAVSTVSHGVEIVVSSVSSVSDAMNNVTAGLKRLITSPPTEEEIKSEMDSSSNCSLSPPNVSGFNEVCMDKSLSKLVNHNATVNDMEIPLLDKIMSDSNTGSLGIAENYFSKPEIFELSSEASIEEIENAIQKSKDLILSCEESTKQRRMLVQQLIQLRLLLERAKEEREVAIQGVQIRQGHQLTPLFSRNHSSTKQFCDKCCHVIWSVLHVTYRCCFCDYQCHGKCVGFKHRKCPSLLYAENPCYIFNICPEVGLAAQDYRCSQCRSLITNKSVWGEPRLCDYTGQYFCPGCHWNFMTAVPARVIHNWDFSPYPVSQQAKHFLTFVSNKPLILLEEKNPHLFKFVNELYVVKKLREDFIIMKDYLRTCRMAQELRLLRRLEVRQHFVDNSRAYSLQDLIDIYEGSLLPFLTEVHKEFLNHIKNTCEVCRGKAFICELCASNEVIFPFDDHVLVCKICQASYHEDCFSSATACPKCLRQSSRRLKLQNN
ncbi:UNVERIFIED_CONTAM: hypothetical protein RMT77_007009 [Armadillidium vulgare]